jgi:hypothetical protein
VKVTLFVVDPLSCTVSIPLTLVNALAATVPALRKRSVSFAIPAPPTIVSAHERSAGLNWK